MERRVNLTAGVSWLELLFVLSWYTTLEVIIGFSSYNFSIGTM